MNLNNMSILQIKNKIILQFKNIEKYLKSDDFSDKVVGKLLTIYLIIGILCIIGIVIFIFTEKWSVGFLSSLGIFLGSQIAGMAVYKNIINTKKSKLIESKLEEEKNSKILKAYYIHLNKLSLKYKDFLFGLKKTVNDSPSSALKDLNIDELYYSDEINNSIYISSLQEMLQHDLHKFTNEEDIVLILNIKEKVLNLIHNSKVARGFYIKNNYRNGYLNFLETMIKDTNEIMDLVENRLNPI